MSAGARTLEPTTAPATRRSHGPGPAARGMGMPLEAGATVYERLNDVPLPARPSQDPCVCRHARLTRNRLTNEAVGNEDELLDAEDHRACRTRFSQLSRSQIRRPPYASVTCVHSNDSVVNRMLEATCACRPRHCEVEESRARRRRPRCLRLTPAVVSRPSCSDALSYDGSRSKPPRTRSVLACAR
jgi:hypothetical protein